MPSGTCLCRSERLKKYCKRSSCAGTTTTSSPYCRQCVSLTPSHQPSVLALHRTNPSSSPQKDHCSADAMSKKSTASSSTKVSRTQPKASLPKAPAGVTGSTSKSSGPNRKQCLCVKYKELCAKGPGCAKVTHMSRAYCQECSVSAGSIHGLVLGVELTDCLPWCSARSRIAAKWIGGRESNWWHALIFAMARL